MKNGYYKAKQLGGIKNWRFRVQDGVLWLDVKPMNPIVWLRAAGKIFIHKDVVYLRASEYLMIEANLEVTEAIELFAEEHGLAV